MYYQTSFLVDHLHVSFQLPLEKNQDVVCLLLCKSNHPSQQTEKILHSKLFTLQCN